MAIPPTIHWLGSQAQKVWMVIGTDDGNGEDPPRLVPPYPHADAAKVIFYGQIPPGKSPQVTHFTIPPFTYQQIQPFNLTFDGNRQVTVAGGLTFIGQVQTDPQTNTNTKGRYAPYGGAGETVPQTSWAWLEAMQDFRLQNFTPAAKAIGFYTVDIGDFSGRSSILITYDDASTEQFEIPHMLAATPPFGRPPFGGNVTYIGMIFPKPVTRIDFLNSEDGFDIFAFAEFAYQKVDEITTPTERPDVPCGHIARRASLTCYELTDKDIIGGKWSSGQNSIINQIVFKVDHDHVLGEFTKQVTFTADDSYRKYGPRNPLVIESKGLRQRCSCVDEFLLERAKSVFSRFADPPASLELDIFYRNHVIEVGDLICLHSRFVPNRDTGKRGVEGERFEVVGIRPGFGQEGKVTLVLLDVQAVDPNPKVTRYSADDEAAATANGISILEYSDEEIDAFEELVGFAHGGMAMGGVTVE